MTDTIYQPAWHSSNCAFRKELLVIVCFRRVCWLAILAYFVANTQSLFAAKPSEALLPNTTKGYLSIPDFNRLETDFGATQLGLLCQDPVMQPFVEDLKRQIKENGARRLEKLGVTLDELRAVIGGEFAVAVLQPATADAAQVMLVDVTDHDKPARELLERIAVNLKKQGGRAGRAAAGDAISIFELPKRDGEKNARQTATFLKDNLLVIGDDSKEVEAIYRAMSSDRKDNLAALPAFKESMAKVAKAGGEKSNPHIRWFVEPFGYVDAMRVIDPPREKPKGPDMLKVLRNQGFTAIQGAGGHVTFKAGNYQTLHRTMIYAPAVTQANPKIKDRYLLAANILDFPNGQNLQPQSWIPREFATYTTWNWNIQNAFPFVGTLVDEVAGDKGVFDDLLDSLKEDRNGPQVDIRKELVGNLGTRVSLVTDYALPISPKSDRTLVGIETTNEKAVAIAIEKSMKGDESVRRREVEGFTVWEVTTKATEVHELAIEIEGGVVEHADLEMEEEVAFQPGKTKQKKKKSSPKAGAQRTIPNSAVCVAYGHLFVSTNIDLLERVLKHAKQQHDAASGGKQDQLSGAADYQLVLKEMNALGATDISARIFSRTDEEFRVTYELIRTNEMPKSESLFGQLLNSALGDGKEGMLRKPRLDGRKLPPFEMARRYFGPAGSFVTSESDGWFLTGFTLAKEMKVE